MIAVTELEAQHRAMWASGHYPRMVETFLLPLGPRLVDACGIGPGDRVLDVAADTGNATIPAAKRGAHAEASDLPPALLDAGQTPTGWTSSGFAPTPRSRRSSPSRSTS
jgi:2-polyprenyl-3-methyl-5-hydroxy-6-metoxy-1,4-benzoquinol methylase